MKTVVPALLLASSILAAFDAPAKAPTLDQLKPQIQAELQRQEVTKYQDELRAKAKITE